MLYHICSDKLRVTISDTGAELQSIQSEDGLEYLWQGDHEVLRFRAPILFPFPSWQYESSYRHRGKIWQVPFLGFLHNARFRLTETTDNMVEMTFAADENTMQMYPFRFRFSVCYQVLGTCLKTVFRVENHDEEAMHFGLGWHPTFRIPLESQLTFNDYHIQFGETCFPQCIERKEGKYFGGFRTFPLENDIRLPFRDREMSEQGVTVLQDMAHDLVIRSEKGRHGVCVSFPDMRLFVLLHKEGVPFITAEAWTSYMGREGVIEDISSRPDLVPVSPGAFYTNMWEINCF